MDKLIFLDIDGVLNDDHTVEYTPDGYTGIDDYHVAQLKKIIDKTNAKIVLSSDWRYTSPQWDSKNENDPVWEYLCNKLKKFDLIISDIVPQYCSSWHSRGREIELYLFYFYEIKDESYQYIILDDLSSYEFQAHLSHLIHTDYKVGLSETDVVEVIQKLNTAE